MCCTRCIVPLGEDNGVGGAREEPMNRAGGGQRNPVLEERRMPGKTAHFEEVTAGFTLSRMVEPLGVGQARATLSGRRPLVTAQWPDSSMKMNTLIQWK